MLETHKTGVFGIHAGAPASICGLTFRGHHVLNQTTKLQKGPGPSCIVPALGDANSWHKITLNSTY